MLRRPRSRPLFALAALLVLVASVRARAQCGALTSSCRDCHESLGQGPFDASRAWHADHALGDFCGDCHGGSPTVHDESAHVGLVDPLAGAPAARCSKCHQDRPDIAAKYLTASSAPTALPPAAPTPERAQEGASPTRPAQSQTANVVLSSLIVALGLGGLGLVFARERRLGKADLSLSRALRRPAWSPYAAGALLGLVVTVSMAWFGRRLSGSGAYQELASPLGRLFQPRSTYWNNVIGPAGHWNAIVLAGAVFGSLAASLWGRRFRLRSMPDRQWASAFGSRLSTRWLIVFAGATLTEIGAGIAGGCTASLAVSGGAALSPGAFAFMAGLFAAGIPTAWLVYRRAS